MKLTYSSLVILLVILAFSQTASAIPTLTTENNPGVLNMLSTTDQYTGSRRWHSVSRSIRDFGKRITVNEMNFEAPFIGTGDLSGLDPVIVITPYNHSRFYEIDDFSSKKDRVDVPEPSIVVLIAFGLIGFAWRKKNN